MKATLLILMLALGACAPSRKLETFGQIPQFQLTAQSGQTFDSREVAGHVWVADFIFTNCPGPCPRMSSKMSELQAATASTPDVMLISFTVDPARDTTSVLSEYAMRFKANPTRWFFLTGKQETLQHLARDAFKLSDVDGSMNHSTRFALIDQKGRVRGFYGTEDGNPVQQIAADARQLRRENN